MNAADAGGWMAGLAEKRVRTALTLVCAGHPYLSGLANAVEIRFGNYVETAGVTASGKILFAPLFFGSLTVRDIAIVVTHELLHLFRRIHERSEGAPDPGLINVADDFIINDIISRSLDCDRNDTVLRDGLIWEKFLLTFREALSFPVRPAHTYSLEEMVMLLRRVPGAGTMRAWRPRAAAAPAPEGWLEKALRKSMPVPPPAEPRAFPPEILSSAMERKIFPDERPEAAARRATEIAGRARQSAGECAALAMVDAIVDQSKTAAATASLRAARIADAAFSGRFEMLRAMYRTPWESALQRWFDSSMPGERSWARPSRRGAWRTDVVLPGRRRQGWTLHVVLDVNESMADSLPAALGALSGFCAANHVETIHLVQVGARVVGDDCLTPEDLESPELQLPNPGEVTPAAQSSMDAGVVVRVAASGGPAPSRRESRSFTRKIMGDPHPGRGVRKRPFRVKRRRETAKPMPLPAVMAVAPSGGIPPPPPYGATHFDPAPAFSLLEEEYGVEAAVVVTGGNVAFPPAPSFDVLWALVGAVDARRFAAPYGTAVHIAMD